MKWSNRNRSRGVRIFRRFLSVLVVVLLHMGIVYCVGLPVQSNDCGRVFANVWLEGLTRLGAGLLGGAIGCGIAMVEIWLWDY